jgi:cytosine/adenosine deaminase-related metal-dependent hydrolase
MILRARTVVTMDGPPIDNGAVAVSGRKIKAVGDFTEIRSGRFGDIVDLGEQILMPGLINAHCHLDYTVLRGKIPRQSSFANWIRAINAEKEKLSPEDYVSSIRHGYEEAKRFGTTTIANLTAFPELIARIQPAIRTYWFAELIDVRDPSQAGSLADRAADCLRPVEHWGLAPHAPYTASPSLFRRCEEIAADASALLTTHLAESEEEMQMACDRSGRLREFLDSLGVDLFESDGITPVEQILDSAGPLHDRWLLIHLNAVLDSDLDRLANAPGKPHVVHCPRSHEYFGHPPFKFAAMQERGLNICLGTDSLATNDDLSLFAEMRQFHRTHPAVPPQQIVEMVTVNPAAALKQANQLGRIRPGFYADLITIPSAAGPNVFEQIITFANSAPSVL